MKENRISSIHYLVSTLPAPDPSKMGWPWSIEEGNDDSLILSQNIDLPRICIVTPSLNQGKYIEETIRSVILQNYPNLEYIIMDGGSTDETLSIIKKYSNWITYWVSKKDGGQAHAIYEGFKKAKSKYIGWLNSDDLLLPNALIKYGTYLCNHQEVDLLVGGGVNIDEEGMVIPPKWSKIDYCNYMKRVNYRKILFMEGFDFMQPASIWRKDAFFQKGGFDTSLRFCFDRDMYLRLTKNKHGYVIYDPVAAFRHHASSKTYRLVEIRKQESKIIAERHGLTKYSMDFIFIMKLWYRFTGILRHKMAILKYFLRIRPVELYLPVRKN